VFRTPEKFIDGDGLVPDTRQNRFRLLIRFFIRACKKEQRQEQKYFFHFFNKLNSVREPTFFNQKWNPDMIYTIELTSGYLKETLALVSPIF
ncbi:MAG: hypothetical protein DWQ10_08300, partial [Calditrichaeota bacterium]